MATKTTLSAEETRGIRLTRSQLPNRLYTLLVDFTLLDM